MNSAKLDSPPPYADVVSPQVYQQPAPPLTFVQVQQPPQPSPWGHNTFPVGSPVTIVQVQQPVTPASVLVFNSIPVKNNVISKMRQLYTVLSMLFLINTLVVVLCIFERHMNYYMWRHKEIEWICLALFLFSILAMLGFRNKRRGNIFVNMIFVFILALTESFMLGAVAANEGVVQIHFVCGILTAVYVGMLIFTLQDRWSINFLNTVVLAGVIILISFVVLASVKMYYVDVLQSFLISLYAAIICFMLVLDSRPMMDGKQRCSFLGSFLCP